MHCTLPGMPKVASVRPLSSLIALAALLTPLAAQWTEVEPAGLVPALALTTGRCAEGPDGSMLLFGADVAVAASALFRFTGAEWTALPNPPLPARRQPAVAFDRARGEFLVFGGGAQPVGGELADTWVYDGLTWTQRSPGTAPSPRRRAACAYDERRQRVVLWGGEDNATTFDDTWEWDGATWASVQQTVPPPAQRGVMVYDDARQECLLLNGVRLLSTTATYRYSGGQWQAAATTTPQGIGVQMAYDKARSRVVAYGQFQNGIETWEWDGRDWRLRASGANPTELLDAGYSPQRGCVIAHGLSALATRVTLAWQPEIRALATPFGANCVDPARVLRTAPGSAPQLGRIVRLEVDRRGNGDLLIGTIGVSRSLSGGSPLPAPLPASNPLGCLLRVDPFQTVLFPASDPAPWSLPIPNTPALLGAVASAQAVFFGTQFSDATNGLELQVGPATPDLVLTETFQTALARDAVASGDDWSNGAVSIALGGSGRHGSLRLGDLTVVGANTYEISTDAQTFPAAQTLSGQAEIVTDGRFEFSDFLVPAGATVRFVGSNPAIVRVRGRVQIDGTVDASGRDQVLFNAHNPIPTSQTTATPGQPGSLGGPGGGRGGRGGDRCLGTGAQPNYDGQNGQDIALPAGHAYAGLVAGTGGRGSPIFPAHGFDSQLAGPPTTWVVTANLINGAVNSGGGGGGFNGLGGTASNATPPGVNFVAPAAFAVGGSAFSLLPLPPGRTSLEHFAVGGSGGGGGGSHPYAGFNVAAPPFVFDRWKAGGGGTGGGGALVLRAGGDLVVGAAGSVRSRGGTGANHNGDNPGTPAQDTLNTSNQNWGVAAPGGGGSGGAVLLQSASNVSALGSIDTSGGQGGRNQGALPQPPLSPPNFGIVNLAGDGAPGFVRLEARAAVGVVGTVIPAPSSGPLLDADAVSGSRSVWLAAGTFELPAYRRYELTVDIQGQLVVFSDDPAVGPPADGSSGPVRVHFQAGRFDPAGGIDPASIGPWRQHVGSHRDTFGISHDRGDAFRFDLVIDRTAGGNPRIVRLAVVYR